MEENTQQSNSFMPMILAAVAILAVAGGAYYFTQMKPQTEQEESALIPADETSLAGSGNDELDTATGSSEMVVDENAQVFEVSASIFVFSLTVMKVKKGDPVRVVFTNDEGTHDWVLDEFDAKTEMLNAGESAEVTFVADETGEFEYYCSVGQHRKMGMVGKLIVE